MHEPDTKRGPGAETMSPTAADETGRLLVQAEDGPGIVAKVSGALSDFGANIVSLDQYSTDPQGGQFFQRTEFHLPDLPAVSDELRTALGRFLTDELKAEWTLFAGIRPKRVAIFVSRL